MEDVLHKYSNTYKVYVLLLEKNKYYVGISKNVEKRFAEHVYGNIEYGAEFTKKYKPIRILHILPTPYVNKVDAEELENKKTIELMKRYGIENVRGGCYVQCDTERLKRVMPKALLVEITGKDK